MSDEQQELPITQDGSVEAAAAAMPDLSYLDTPAAKVEQHRENGRFAKNPDNVVELKPNTEPAKAAAEQQEEPADDAEDEIEYTPEGAEAPVRLKLSEALSGYQEAQRLKGEIENVKKTAPMPVDYEAALRDVVGKQVEYTRALDDWAKYNKPQMPDERLLDQRYTAYDPDLYYQQLNAARQRHAQIEATKAEVERLNKDTAEKQSALDKAYEARESAKRKELWPEYETDTGRKQAYADVERHYGLKGSDLDDVRDHRAIHIIKDALAYRELLAKQEKVVKHVQTKPKLIPSQARGTGNSKQAKAAEASARLAKSGSMDDAVSALDALLG